MYYCKGEINGEGWCKEVTVLERMCIFSQSLSNKCRCDAGSTLEVLIAQASVQRKKLRSIAGSAVPQTNKFI